MSDANVELVRRVYGAYGRGDIAEVMASMADDISWECVGRPSDFIGLGPRKGCDQVAEFFSIVLAAIDYDHFEAKEFYAVDDKVFVLGHYAMTGKTNGRKMDSDWIHIITIQDGKVTCFREFTDTAQVAYVVCT